MKPFSLSLALVLGLAAPAAFGALAELNVAAGTIGTDEYNARDVTIAPGFRLELLHIVPFGGGSWLPVTWDNKGRLLVGSHNSNQLFRLTIPRLGSNDAVKAEPISLEIGSVHGLEWTANGLYASVGDSPGAGRRPSGIYRLRDTNGDDQYDQVRVIRNINGGGQHGTHAVHLAPDGKSLFMINGNAVAPTVFDGYRMPPVFGEDTLTPRLGTNGSVAPQGWLGRFDPEGEKWTLYAGGMRNPVDFAFNKDGEMFEYDADMEFDKGLSFYRPTHVGHIISGADFGFRSPQGSAKWPQYYIDDWGPVVNIGSGSPTGVTLGTGAKFPARYQDAFFIADWSYGNIYSVFLNPQGSSYAGTVELFASGRPFGVTGMTVNKADGTLLVVIGGNTQSAIYRVAYTGTESTTPTKPDTRYADQRDLRHSLERFHGVKQAASVAAAWPQLSSDDRGIRYAARTALEFQDQALWREKALAETDPKTAIAAIVALARLNGADASPRPYATPAPSPDKALQRRMLAALDRIDWAALTYQDRLDLLRAYSLTFIRLGAPDSETRQRLIARFDAVYPALNRELNWELAEMMVYLEAPTAAAKTMALLRSSPSLPYFPKPNQYINPLLLARGTPGGAKEGSENVTLAKQEDQTRYAEVLSNLKTGWTRELREEYLNWFLTAPTAYQGGSNFGSFITQMRQQAVAKLTDEERTALQPILAKFPAATGRGGAGGGGGGARGGQ
jgi:hypothetical protein